MIVSLSVAMTHNYVMGREGSLPWTPDDVPGELALFKKTTAGKPVVMGRKTWESLPQAMTPLRGRPNVILSRDEGFHDRIQSTYNCGLDLDKDTPVRFFGDLDPALAVLAVAGYREAVVIGGAEVFAEAYKVAEKAYLTIVSGSFEGDTYFPRAILSDPRWAWGPDPVKGKGWTRHILTRRPAE